MIRKQWKKGDELLVWSDSAQKWCIGTIKQILKKQWLNIQYMGGPNCLLLKEKQVQRYNNWIKPYDDDNNKDDEKPLRKKRKIDINNDAEENKPLSQQAQQHIEMQSEEVDKIISKIQQEQQQQQQQQQEEPQDSDDHLMTNIQQQRQRQPQPKKQQQQQPQPQEEKKNSDNDDNEDINIHGDKYKAGDHVDVYRYGRYYEVNILSMHENQLYIQYAVTADGMQIETVAPEDIYPAKSRSTKEFQFDDECDNQWDCTICGTQNNNLDTQCKTCTFAKPMPVEHKMSQQSIKSQSTKPRIFGSNQIKLNIYHPFNYLP